MKPSARSASNPGQPVIAVDAREGVTFVVAFAAEPNPKVLETLEAAPGDAAAIAAIASRHNTQRLIVVAPIADSFAKFIPTPNALPGPERVAAHMLAAEAMLPDGIAPWRIGCGPVSSSAPAAWAIASGLLAEPPTKVSGLDLAFASSAASLAAIAGVDGPASIHEFGGGRCDFDASESTPRLRCHIGSPALPGTAHTRISSASAAALRERVSLPTTDPAWIERFGLALGAALLATDTEPLTASLGGLRWKEPAAAEVSPVRLTRWLASPARAAAVLAAAVLLLLLGRWGFAYVRHEILASKLASMDGSRSTREDLQKRAALYNQLSNERTGRLPMTKLLHDLSRIAPVGVSVPNLRLSPEQGLVIQGQASKSELITTFEQNLNATKMLRSLKRTRNENTADGVEFELTAEIVQPHLAIATKEDFATTPLAVRLHGPDTVSTAVTPAAKPAPRAERTARTGASGLSSSGSETSGQSRRPSESSDTPPVPLSDADIEKLPRGKTILEFGTRRGYLQKNEKALDGPTKERLAAEVEKLKARMEATRESKS